MIWSIHYAQITVRLFFQLAHSHDQCLNFLGTQTSRVIGGRERQPKLNPQTAVASSDHRNAGGLEDLMWSLPSQAPSRVGC